MNHLVIMAGGTGTRLWPLSRQESPKQFQKLIGEQTLIQQTFERAKQAVDNNNIWVVTTDRYRELTTSQLPDLESSQIIIEPVGRNTAAAVGLATLKIAQIDPGATIGVVAADHHIGKPAVFEAATRSIWQFLGDNPHYLVTIGINPTEPNTGYGYIEMGEQLDERNGQKVFAVSSFVEKPDLATAKKLVERWEYLWNSGCFFFQAATMQEHYQRHAKEIFEALQHYIAHPSPSAYEKIPAQPVDKAIAEKVGQLAVVPADMEWSDVGNWATLHDILGQDGREIKEVTVGEHISVGSEKTLVFGGKKLIVTVGIKDAIIIDTDDALLVCTRDSVQDVKKVVEKLEQDKKQQYL